MYRTLFFLLSLVALTVFADPELFIEQPHFDFGAKTSGTLIEHEFLLENRGDEHLNITDIKASCGCTTSENRTLVLKPGESKPLEVTMDLKGRSGPQKQSITLSTNDPKNRTFHLILSGEAVPDIVVKPRTLNLKQQDMGDVHQGEIQLISTTGEAFELIDVNANRDRVVATVDQAEDGLSATIRVKSKPQEGQGHFTDVLEIQTSNPNLQKIRVLIMWQISTGISISPGQVNLVLDDEAGVLNRYLMVRGYPGLKEPLEVTAVEWPGQDVEISFADTKKFGWRIHLKSFVPTSAMKDSEILIHTNAEGFDTLNVPVRLIER